MRIHRRHRSDDVTSESEPGGPQKRGWGPFTGGQLTAIILGLLLAIAFPIGAWAVSGTTVFVTDKGTGVTAAVNASRQLSVAGVVTARPTPGSLSYNVTNGLNEAGGCDNATAAVPAGRALVVTSLNVTIDSVTTGPVAIVVGAGTSGSPCTVATFLDYSKVPGAPVTETVPFTSGLFIKSGHTLDVALLSISGNAAGSASVHGYMVASSLCQSGSALPSHTGCW